MHENKPIYLDYQASTPLCDAAYESMLPFLDKQWANPHSAQHIDGINSMLKIDEARQCLARFIGADTNEIIFTSGATEANNLALQGLRNTKSDRNRILVSAIEHKAVLAPASYMSENGFVLELIPVDERGIVQIDAFNAMISDDVLLVSVMTASNEVGCIQPIKLLSEIANKRGAIFHTDAAQAAVHMDLDVEEMGVDLLSLSSHKMYGPKGIGLLYVSNYVRDQLTPIIFGGGQEQDLRSGTLPTALCVGFGSAAKHLFDNWAEIRRHIKDIRDHFYSELNSNVGGVRLIGQSLEQRHIGNLCVSFSDVDADELLGILQTEIAASTGSACTSNAIQPSHVLKAMNLGPDVIEGSVRFSFGLPLARQDVERAARYVADAVIQCRQA